VDRVGKDGPRVNPFALEPTESNIKFLYSFIKLLLTNGGAELELEDDDVIHKAVQDMYLLDSKNRRLSNLFLPKKLNRYLSKWVGRASATRNSARCSLLSIAPSVPTGFPWSLRSTSALTRSARPAWLQRWTTAICKHSPPPPPSAALAVSLRSAITEVFLILRCRSAMASPGSPLRRENRCSTIF